MVEKEIKKRAIAEMSTDARVLLNFMDTKLKKAGDFISYGELSDAVRRNVQDDARGIMQTAKKHLEAEKGIIIETVIKQGLKVVDSYTGSIGISEGQLNHIRRTTRKQSRRIMNALNGNSLEDEQKTAIFGRLASLGAILQFSKQSSVKKLEGHIKTNPRELPVNETLELFGSK